MNIELINKVKETLSILEKEFNREAKNFESETDYIDKAISQQRLDQLEDTIKQLSRCIRDFSKRSEKGFVRFDDELILTDEERKAKEKNLMDHLKRLAATSNPSIQLYSGNDKLQTGNIVVGGEVKTNSDEVPNTKKEKLIRIERNSLSDLPFSNMPINLRLQNQYLNSFSKIEKPELKSTGNFISALKAMNPFKKSENKNSVQASTVPYIEYPEKDIGGK